MSEHSKEEHEDEKPEGEVNSDVLEAAFTEHEFGNEEEDDHHPKAPVVEEDDPSPEWHTMDDQDSW